MTKSEQDLRREVVETVRRAGPAGLNSEPVQAAIDALIAHHKPTFEGDEARAGVLKVQVERMFARLDTVEVERDEALPRPEVDPLVEAVRLALHKIERDVTVRDLTDEELRMVALAARNLEIRTKGE